MVLLWSVLGIFRLLIVAAKLSDHDVIDLPLYLEMVMALRGEGADLEIAKTFKAPVPLTDCLAPVLMGAVAALRFPSALGSCSNATRLERLDQPNGFFPL